MQRRGYWWVCVATVVLAGCGDREDRRPIAEVRTVPPVAASAQTVRAGSRQAAAAEAVRPKALQWVAPDGWVEAGEGSLVTKQAFGDCQLHVEWMAPTEPPPHLTSRGNSGVILMGQYEIQIWDSHPSHAEQIYPDGQAASIYGQTPPRVNACRAPGEWQSFDIVFTAPVFEGEKLARPAFVTMFHNGVLVHLNQQIMGPMAHAQIIPYSPHPAKLPLVLQGHGSPVRFRNVWIRPLGE